jgi:hypothetical protein
MIWSSDRGSFCWCLVWTVVVPSPPPCHPEYHLMCACPLLRLELSSLLQKFIEIHNKSIKIGENRHKSLHMLIFFSLALLLEKQNSNWYVSILDLHALLTGCQPSTAVSFIQPHIKYTLTLVAAFIRIVIFYIGSVFVIGLIMPSNADVFIGGSNKNKITTSPFVHGKHIPPFMAHTCSLQSSCSTG